LYHRPLLPSNRTSAFVMQAMMIPRSRRCVVRDQELLISQTPPSADAGAFAPHGLSRSDPSEHSDDQAHPFAGQAKFSLTQVMSSMLRRSRPVSSAGQREDAGRC
jgi:hypothetical protein